MNDLLLDYYKESEYQYSKIQKDLLNNRITQLEDLVVKLIKKLEKENK